MATSTIKQSTAIESVTLGGASYTAQVTYYIKKAIKQNGRVTIQLSCWSDINLPMNKAIATIPVGYRPSANVDVPGIVLTDGDVLIPAAIHIGSNGEITQSSTNLCRKVYVCADYAL